MDKKAFTLVELIVTIVVLSILLTIAFFSSQWYWKLSRDSLRISDMSTIRTSLEIFYLNSNKYPDPTELYPVTYSWGLAWNQWSFWDSTFINVDKLNEIPVDPLTWKEYIYSVLNTKQEYEIAWIMESDDNVSYNNLSLEVVAFDNIARAMITWTYNGIWLRVNTETTSFVLAVPSIITSIDLATEINRKLESIIPQKQLVLDGYKNLPNNYIWTKYIHDAETLDPKFKIIKDNSIDNLVIFEWSIKNLTPVALVVKTQEVYSWTVLWWKTVLNELMSLSTENLYEEERLDNFWVAFINENLKWSAVNRIYSTCWGVAHNTTKSFYTWESVTFTDWTCDILKKNYICRDWTWKDWDEVLDVNLYKYDSCIVNSARTCNIETIDPLLITTINHSDTYNIYSKNTIIWDSLETCDDLWVKWNVTCNDGILEWDLWYKYNTCAKWIPLNCNAQNQWFLQSYSVPDLIHADTYNDFKNIDENEGIFKYTINVICNDWIFSIAETWPTIQSCNLNYSIVWNECLADTKNFTCNSKPLNTLWNTSSSYTQTWSGSEWLPEDSFPYYNITSSIEECRYKCNIWYHTEDNNSCISNISTCSVTNGEWISLWNWSSWDCSVSSCDIDYYDSWNNLCSPVWNGYYSTTNSNTRISCSNHPDTTSRNYTYTSDGNWSNSCNATYTNLCWVDKYESTNGTCSDVWNGYYSTTNSNTRISCSNKPSNSTYTSDGNWSNSCLWNCSNWYTQNWNICTVTTYYPWCNEPDIIVWSTVLSSCNVWTNTAGSYGNYFQFGKTNNSWTWCNSPSNTYDWTTVGWTGLGSSDYWGVSESEKYTATYDNQNSIDQEKMKWPCSTWYHIPTYKEWSDLNTSLWLYNSSSIRNSLKLPLPWLISFNWNTYFVNEETLYWSSSPNWDSGFGLGLASSLYNFSDSRSRCAWFPIRCFKN